MSNKAIDLLYLAKRSKIDIGLNDGQLQLKLPKNTSIDKNLLQDLKDNKEIIVDFLKNNLRNTNNQNKIARFDRNSVSKIPLSYSQERLWFIDRLEGSVQYHMTPILRLKGELNGKAVEHALKTIIDRHEILRTVFCEDQGHGYQVIKEKGNWMLSEVDGSAFKENYAALQQYLDALIKQPFDLSKDYMLRAHLIRIDDNDHVLAAIIHHIASDGWSISVLVKEVVELYNAFNENRPAALPMLDVQYADYSIWQRGFLGGELFDRKIGYWKNKLEGVEILQLPTDYARPAVQSTRGATIRSVIKKEVSIRLQDFSKQQGGTFFMALLAAFKVLLSRYSGQQDICVGTPIAGRQQQELEGLIGFFVNTLAIRTEVNGEDTFTDFFQQVRKVTMEAFDNQEIPFEKIVDEVVKERSLSRSPLFQVMMVYMNTPEVPEMRLGEIKLSKENLERTTAKFDIQVFLTDTPEGLSMIIEYCTDLFCEASMNRMMGHFKELILSIITDPLQKIGDLSMLPKAEEQQLLVELNNTARDYPKDKTVISFFEQQVTKTPDAIAVIFEEEQFTYAELNRLANQLAYYLRSKGVKEETLVPLCVERSPQMIVGIWGILKAGAAYVPIDPEYPEDRISYMLEDTNATLIITSKDCLDKISATGNIEAIILDKSFSLISDESVVNLDIPVSNNHLAYVIYTSGSTGKPKGAMNEHGALSNRLLWAQDYFNLTHQDAVLQKTTFCFDVSVWELIWPLLVGARLVFAKPGGQKDNIYIKSVIEKNKITVLHFVPSMLNVFLPDLRSGDCMSLTKVLCSGEALKNSHVELFKKKLPKVELHNLYGPTEAAIDVTCWSLDNADQQIDIIPIGKPISNTRIYILDKNEKLSPKGGIGEIHIGGIQVARGYLNRPELTAQKFIEDRFDKTGAYKLYKTGDLGRWMPDGNIEYLGRKDDQVKIRGYRIELGEVETVINSLQQVNSNCVVVKNYTDNNSLVSYFVPNSQVVKDKERELYQAQISSWKDLYETEYEQTEDSKDVEEEFNIVSWNDSFTGEAIPGQVMAEWVKLIVDKILEQHPENVLEIGCGTGLIYYQLAGKVKKYIGTDFSTSSIKQIKHRIGKGLRDYGQTELYVSSAHEIKIKKEEPVDTIILNSVVQYFPGEGYLNDVIENSISILDGSGRIIIGDVRDYRNLGLFKGRLQLNKMQPSVNVKEFKWAIDQDILKEEELCISPEYFYRLKSIYPTITHVDIQWKKASFINELSLYRYDVIIYVGIQHPLLTVNWQPFAHQNDKLHFLEQIEKSVDRIALKDVYNPRLWKERLLAVGMENKIVNTVSDLISAIENEDRDSKDIKEIIEFAKTKGYRYRLFLNEDPLKMDILLELNPSESFITQEYSYEVENNNIALTNHPLFTDISFLLQKDIKALLKERLPEYMVPSEMIALARLPLNNNGKTDRKFLSEREEISITKKFTYQPPVTDLQSKLALVWQELLRIERVGIEDNFFDLGGHSLMIIRLISAIRSDFEVELSVKDIFVYNTISSLSRYLESLQNTGLVLPPIVALERPMRIPLSFSQERLYFVDRLEGTLPFHLPSVLKLNGKLDKSALAYALQTIVDRHEVLRTVFLEEDGFPYQFIKEKNGWNLTITDGSIYAKDQTGLNDHIKKLLVRPFNLSKDYTLRADLLTLGEREHVLILILHHIASDAWSSGIMVKELLYLYKACADNKQISLPALKIQYADYAMWQRNNLSGELLNNKLNYWKQKLQGIEPLQLPTDFQRPPVQSSKGTSTRFAIDKILIEKLKDLGKQEESTLFMTLLAAFKTLLYRYTSQQDVCVGTSIAGRQQQEIEPLIGFFVNMLALRTELDPGASFNSLLKKVKQTTLEAYEHQEVPFEKVVDAVVKERDVSRSPIFQALFVMLNTPGAPDIILDDLTLSRVSHEQTSSKYDITFFVTENSQGLSGSVEYNTELFSEETIFRIIGHFNELLVSIAEDPQKKLSDLTMITKTEKHQLVHDFNDNASAYPRDKTIVDLFEEQVVKSPGAIALVFENEVLTYQQLNERANQLGFYLRKKGVGINTMIPISVERSAEMIVGIIGILKAGGAYVPIDPEYPAERIGFMLGETGSNLIITSKLVKSKLTVYGDIEMIEIDGDWQVLNEQPKDNLSTFIEPSSLAYVIYTSGSTGKPKGVMVSHKNVVSLVKGVEYVSLTFEDILLSTGSSSFDATTLEYWGMLLNGGQLVLCPENKLLDNKLLKEEINNRRVNRMWFTSGWFNQLVEADITIFEKLSTVLVGGEKLSPTHIEKLRQTYPAVEIINGYGPTENTTFSLTYRINETTIKKSIPIGRPLNNRSAFILDEYYNIVPIGVNGEICLSGDGLSRGYLNRPELTLEKFVESPFGNTMIYKTGDIGRWLPDGNIEYIGRKDEQVKIRGFRIELGEIESVLQECEEVKHAVVMARADQEGTKRLVGYIVPNSEYDKSTILAYLKNKLPEYMVPAIMVEMETLPLNPNGKVDRKALPDPELVDLTNKEFVAPRNHGETILANIWQELLGLDEIGIHDNFFELGGDSLLAIRVVSAIRKELQIEMPISNLFEYQTIATLAKELSPQKRDNLLPPIQSETRLPRIPLSFSQERLWFIDRLEGSLQYHIPAVMRLKGNLNIKALEHALSSILNRHEVLRTVFLEQDGDAYQLVKNRANWELPIIDGTLYNNDKKGLQNLIQQLITVAFDLSKDNMLRAHLVVLNPMEHILVVTLHHIASDGWSRSILVKEVTELYTAFEENRAADLVPIPIQYADFAIWQRNYLQGGILDKKLGYWKEKLQGTEPLQMPLDFPRPAIQTIRGGSVSFAFDKDLSVALQNLSQQNGSTLFMVLLASLKVLLYRYTSQGDICVGTGSAGRQQKEVEGLIGFFVNTLALRDEVKANDNFIELLQKIRKTTLEAYESQEVPFEKIVDALVKKRDRSRNPIFQVMFVLQNTPEIPTLKLGELEFAREGYEHATAQFDLSFSMIETTQGLNGSLEYNTDLYKRATVERLLMHFHQLVVSIVSEPQKKICEFSFMSKDEADHILFNLNDNNTVYPAEKTIIAIFEEQVAAYPESIAVIFDNEELTYYQLNNRANQLARHLQSKGVKAETLVAISIERSLEMIVGILGILKAGGAYVPIDAEYPADRITFMLEDTGAGIIITSNKVIGKLPTGNKFEAIRLDGSWTEIAKQSTADLRITVEPGSLAYIIYTSGSTGKPKGVMVTQKNVVSLVKGIDYVSLSKEDVLLSTGSSSFDATTIEYWGMLLNGGQLVICEEQTLLNSDLLKAEIDKRKVTKMWFTSSWFNELVENHISVFERLNTIMVGGEKLSEHHIEKLRRTYSQIEIINGYGPTENTTFSLTYTITDFLIRSAIPIGRPLNNRKAYILDEHQQLVPVGVPGEICLGGDGLSRGYLKRPNLTAEKFVKHPFSKNGDEKIYKTGDIGRWLPDGNIEYLGRIDDQVKIRGYRIELGEIEAVLQQSNLISQAVVLPWLNKEQNKILVGYIVPSDNYDKNILIAYLREKLPDYMIPSIWVELDRFSLTSNGKVDKRALPEPDLSYVLSDQYVPPATEIEIKLFVIWKDILRIERIGIRDNFFELGGHSLLAMRLISAIRKELLAELVVRELFMYPTIAELAAYIQKVNNKSLLPSIEVHNRPEHIPLSFSQERLWFIDQLEGSVQYNSPTALRLKGRLNVEALIYALQNIIKRHEVLRTVFYESDGKPYQSVIDIDDWHLSFVNGSEYKKDPTGLKRFIENLIAAPFDLSKDYMLRADLIKLEEKEHVLVVTMHHIASDGWSLPIIVQEVVELYNSFQEKRPTLLAQLPMQYVDYSIWQRKYLQGEVMQKRISYWKTKLAGVSPLELPTDYARPSVRTTVGSSMNFMIEKELSDKLNELNKEHGTTLFMTLLATYMIMLSRYTGQQDICVGTSIANRPHQQLEGLIGFFVSTLALRNEMIETFTFIEFLQRVKVTTLDAYENQDVPFEKVVEEVVKERDPGRSPLFQVMLVLLNTPESSMLGFSEIELSNEAFEIKISKFDFTFHISQSSRGLPFTVVYNTDLFREDTIIRMAGHFKQLLNSIIKEPHQNIDLLQMLTTAEEQQLLVEFN